MGEVALGFPAIDCVRLEQERLKTHVTGFGSAGSGAQMVDCAQGEPSTLSK
jgi:hypothetical protein